MGLFDKIRNLTKKKKKDTVKQTGNNQYGTVPKNNTKKKTTSPVPSNNPAPVKSTIDKNTNTITINGTTYRDMTHTAKTKKQARFENITHDITKGLSHDQIVSKYNIDLSKNWDKVDKKKKKEEKTKPPVNTYLNNPALKTTKETVYNKRKEIEKKEADSKEKERRAKRSQEAKLNLMSDEELAKLAKEYQNLKKVVKNYEKENKKDAKKVVDLEILDADSRNEIQETYKARLAELESIPGLEGYLKRSKQNRQEAKVEAEKHEVKQLTPWEAQTIVNAQRQGGADTAYVKKIMDTLAPEAGKKLAENTAAEWNRRPGLYGFEEGASLIDLQRYLEGITGQKIDADKAKQTAAHLAGEAGGMIAQSVATGAGLLSGEEVAAKLAGKSGSELLKLLGKAAGKTALTNAAVDAPINILQALKEVKESEIEGKKIPDGVDKTYNKMASGGKYLAENIEPGSDKYNVENKTVGNMNDWNQDLYNQAQEIARKNGKTPFFGVDKNGYLHYSFSEGGLAKTLEYYNKAENPTYTLDYQGKSYENKGKGTFAKSLIANEAMSALVGGAMDTAGILKATKGLNKNLASGINPELKPEVAAPVNKTKVVPKEKDIPDARTGRVTPQNMTPDTFDRIAGKLESRSGAKIKTVDRADINGADGMYQNGTIYIAKDASDPAYTVLKHELTHHIETSENYDAFQDFIIKSQKERGVDVNKELEELRTRYKNAGVDLEEGEEVREYVANFAQEYLFNSEESINRLARENPSLFRQIYDWIVDTVSKLTGDSDTKYLIEAQRKYEKALRTVNSDASEESKYLFTRATPEQSAQADKMKAKGATPEEIKKALNVHEGLDKNLKPVWKSELDDSRAVLDKDFENGIKNIETVDDFSKISNYDGEPIRLGDILDHPELYKEHPELRDTKVSLEYSDDNYIAMFDLGENGGEIALNLKKNSNDIKGDILHEIQHAIQIKQGLQSGNIPDKALEMVRNTVRKKLEASSDAGYIKAKEKGAEVASKYVDDYILREYNEDNIKDVGDKAYWNLAGEKEARSASKRKNLSEEARRDEFPDYEKGSIYENGKLLRKQGHTQESLEIKQEGKNNRNRMPNRDNVTRNTSHDFMENRKGNEEHRADYKELVYSESNKIRLDKRRSGVDTEEHSRYRLSENVLGKKKYKIPEASGLEKRVSGDDLYIAQDNVDTAKSVGAKVDKDGYITVYHRTSKENADKIRSSGVMGAKEDGVFFSTKANGQNSGYGDELIEFKIPAEKLQLDDIFDDEAHFKVPLKNKNSKLDVSGYLVGKADNGEIPKAYSVDSQGRQLSEGQQKKFKDSKAVDEEGNLLTLYHGTQNDFNVFDFSQGGKNGTQEGFGIYLTDNPEVSKQYGNRQLEVYADIKKPAYSDKKTIKNSEIKKLIKATCEKEAREIADDYDGNLEEAIRDTWISNYVDTYSASSMNDAYNEMVDTLLQFNNNDIDIIQEIISGQGLRNYDEVSKFYDLLTKETGFDGIMTKWTSNQVVNGKETRIILAFNSEQVKRTDNLNPTNSKDIRYAIPDNKKSKRDEKLYNKSLNLYGEKTNKYIKKADVKDTASFNGEIPKAKEPVKEIPKADGKATAADKAIPGTKKAEKYERRQVRNFDDSVKEALGIVKYSDNKKIKNLTEDMVEKLKSGSLSDADKDKLFAEMFSEGLAENENYVNTYKEVRDRIRNVRLQINDDIKNNITDYKAWRNENRHFRFADVGEGNSLPIDTFYHSMQELHPDVFPDVRTQSEMLEELGKVANTYDDTYKRIEDMTGNLDEFYEYGRQKFYDAVDELEKEVNIVKRYKDSKTVKSYEEVQSAQKDIKKLKRKYEKLNDEIILTDDERDDLNKFVKGKISEEKINRDYPETSGKILTLAKAKKEYMDASAELKGIGAETRKAYADIADDFLQNSDRWNDKSYGLQYARETPERNMIDVAGKTDGKRLNEEYFENIHKHEADANKMKQALRDEVRSLNIDSNKKIYSLDGISDEIKDKDIANDLLKIGKNGKSQKVSESAILQLYGEGVISKEGVRAVGADADKIERAALKMREIYNQLLDAANQEYMKHGYEPIEYRKDYFPHFEDNKPNGPIAKIADSLGIDIQKDDLPTDIAGLTHTFRPGRKWFGNALSRTGTKTEYDAIKGFDIYLEGISDVIHHTEDIQKLRTLENTLRYKYSDKGIRDRLDDLDKRLSEGEINNSEYESLKEKIYETGNTKLSNMAVWLRDYTDNLAGKKEFADRKVEHDVGRTFYNATKAIEGRIAANMVAVNPGSWLTNFIPLTQGGNVSTKDVIRGMAETLQNKVKPDMLMDQSTFFVNRKGSDVLWKSNVEKVQDFMTKPMQIIDEFVSESMVRAKYNADIKKGIKDVDALRNADAFAAEVIADRSKGALPNVFNRNNPLTKIFTMYQVEVNNQWSHLLKDIPRNADSKAAVALAFTNFAVGAYIFNDVYEELTGRRSAMDPISWVNDFMGDATGYKIPNFVEAIEAGLSKEKEVSFKVEKAKDTGTAVMNLGKNIAQDIPYVGGVLEGGRVPISSALPEAAVVIPDVVNMASGEMNKKKGLEEVGKELAKPLTYIVPPVGGGQVKKMVQAGKTLKNQGVYGYDKDGNKKLKYAVDRTPSNVVKGMLFGQYAMGNAKDYVNSFESLDANKTSAYINMVQAGMKPTEAEKYVKSLNDSSKKVLAKSEAYAQLVTAGVDADKAQKILSTIPTKRKAETMRKVILNSDLTGKQKNIIGNMLEPDRKIDYTNEATYKYSLMTDDQKKKVDKYKKNAGLSTSKAVKAYEAKKGLSSQKDQALALIEAGYSKKVIQALEPSISDNSYAMSKQMHEAGITVKEYTTARKKANTNHNSYVSMDEAQIYLDKQKNMSRAEKYNLFAALTGCKPSNNRYK